MIFAANLPRAAGLLVLWARRAARCSFLALRRRHSAADRNIHTSEGSWKMGLKGSGMATDMASNHIEHKVQGKED
jgi:hypothetical protein